MNVLITGATGGIGAALAREYAEVGNTLLLQGRRQDALDAVAAECQAKGATVMTAAFDLRDEAALRLWIAQVELVHPLDLVVANAGLNTDIGPARQGESWEQSRAVVDVNLIAAMVLIDAVLPGMRKRGRGQLALVSSLAAYFGLPLTPSYCASKAGLKAYGEALRGWLAPQGVKVNVVMPGYVVSPMAQAMPGPKPFMLAAADAAVRIRRGLAANRARIGFPFLLSAGTWWLAVLPAGLSGWIVRRMGYA